LPQVCIGAGSFSFITEKLARNRKGGVFVMGVTLKDKSPVVNDRWDRMLWKVQTLISIIFLSTGALISLVVILATVFVVVILLTT
jgi:hypothetical protein